MKRIILACAALSLGGCTAFSNYWNSLTPAQQVTLTFAAVNGVCVATEVGTGLYVTSVAIAAPNANEANLTAKKVAAINVESCKALGTLTTQIVNGMPIVASK